MTSWSSSRRSRSPHSEAAVSRRLRRGRRPGWSQVRFRRYALLVAVLLTSLLLLTVQTRGGGPARAGDLVALALTPVQNLLTKAHRGALSVWNSYADWKRVRAENLALHAENERLRIEALQARETDQENRRLRRLATLRERLPLTTLGGEIIGREGGGWSRSLTVNRGRADGVAQQMPVIVPDGLVGRVVQVRAGASVVQLLNDPLSEGHPRRTRHRHRGQGLGPLPFRRARPRGRLRPRRGSAGAHRPGLP
ncbi:MAG: hypothetical protein DME16_01405 [Candidatus Rokuibacteriota bacterium]|nr:MAG: hypothetical protein DME16_01405 [Candidatus Rokubacteria bacterium]